MNSHIIPEVQHLQGLQGESVSWDAPVLCAHTLLVWLADTSRPVAPISADPFDTIHEEQNSAEMLDTILDLLERSTWRKNFDEALRQLVRPEVYITDDSVKLGL